MDRLLLLLPTRTYRTEDFVDAAGRLGVDLVCASERPSTLEGLAPDSLLTLDFGDPDAAAAKAAAFARAHPLKAVVGVDDLTSTVAAAIAERLSLRTSPRAAVAATRDKHEMRRRLAAAGVPVPRFRAIALADDLPRVAREVDYPVVLKPLSLSASRGVIRADDPEAFVAAAHRIAAILARDDAAAGGPAASDVLVEAFIPGVEVAVEGLLAGGALHVLALFDKPDPLDGPFFEETIYVTPSRLPEATQRRIADVTREACAALGLTEGPIHAELRVNERGPWVLEIAARSIGGLCSRTLRFGTGMTLEEIILRHALGWPVDSLARERRAAGVMMLPIPRAGRLLAVDGVEDAAAVPGVEDVTISIPLGQEVEPLPEGWQYLG
ncbi:MAG: ATP-grasp domain-containing protein, partial [Candidatus Rokubacteria bacterium]|nr:ATP-grasp domain-containing protein [Candidatus Rokubacteria bacterium]